MEEFMNPVDYNEQDKNYVKEIIYYENRDWFFTVKTKDDTNKNFVISWNKGGGRWIELWHNYDEFKSLESAIIQDPTVKIIENDTTRDLIKYVRQTYEFSIMYVDYVDYLIDSHWDGDPFIAFSFVEKGHPNFEAYVNELLRLSDLLKKIK